MTNLDDILAEYETSDHSMVRFTKTGDAPVLGEAAVVIEGEDQQALVDFGWDSSGVYVDVRTFVDRELTTPVASWVLRTLNVRPGHPFDGDL